MGPTFPDARYLFGRVEYEHWSTQTERADTLPVFADSIRPIFGRGLADLVEWDHRTCPEIRLMPSTGHTPGHASVLIDSKGSRAMITGDFAHHPCQMAHPDGPPPPTTTLWRPRLHGAAFSASLPADPSS